MSEIEHDENGHLVQDLSRSRREVLAKEIKSLVLDPKIRKLPVDELARKYQCSRAEIFSAKNKVILALPQQNVEFVKRKFALQFEKLENLVEDLIESSEDNDETRKNVELALKVTKEYTDYLERFHLKRKATEQIQLDGEVKVTGINVKIVDSKSPKPLEGQFIEKDIK